MKTLELREVKWRGCHHSTGKGEWEYRAWLPKHYRIGSWLKLLEHKAKSSVMYCRYCCLLAKPDSFVTPWTVASQVPQSMGFPRQKYWSRLPFSSSGDLPGPRLNPCLPLGRRILDHWATWEVNHNQSFKAFTYKARAVADCELVL